MNNETMSIACIWKYNLEIYGNSGNREFEVDCVSIVPLSVEEQDGELMLWAFVTQREGENKTHRLNVRVKGTGHPIFLGRDDMPGELEGMSYIGTVPMTSGFVWHVYANAIGAK